jgi:hypothetical protein
VDDVLNQYPSSKKTFLYQILIVFTRVSLQKTENEGRAEGREREEQKNKGRK